MIFVSNYHQQTHVFDLINGLLMFFSIQINSYFVFGYISLLEAGQIDQAEKEKARIEQAQRSRSSTDLCPQWFKQDGDSFVLIRDEDPTHDYWKKREENWTNVEFTQLWQIEMRILSCNYDFLFFAYQSFLFFSFSPGGMTLSLLQWINTNKIYSFICKFVASFNFLLVYCLFVFSNYDLLCLFLTNNAHL